MSHRRPGIGLALALLAASALAHPPVRYTVQNLGRLDVPAYNGVYPSGINRAGQISAQASPDNVSSTAVITGPDGSGGHVIPGLGGAYSRALALNNHGRVVGSSSLGDGTAHAFVTTRDGARMIDLGTLGGRNSEAQDINDDGVIVGWSDIEADWFFHPFRFDMRTGKMKEVALPPGAARGGIAYTVNRNVEIAGSFETHDGDHPFITGANGANPIDLGTYGGTEGWANAINAHGQAVGSACDKKGIFYGFITEPRGGQHKIAYVDPDGRSVELVALNDQGIAVGYDYGIIPFYQYRAVVAAPGELKLHVLDDLVSIPGVSLLFATAVNNAGQITTVGFDGNVYLLSPVR